MSKGCFQVAIILSIAIVIVSTGNALTAYKLGELRRVVETQTEKIAVMAKSIELLMEEK